MRGSSVSARSEHERDLGLERLAELGGDEVAELGLGPGPVHDRDDLGAARASTNRRSSSSRPSVGGAECSDDDTVVSISFRPAGPADLPARVHARRGTAPGRRSRDERLELALGERSAEPGAATRAVEDECCFGGPAAAAQTASSDGCARALDDRIRTSGRRSRRRRSARCSSRRRARRRARGRADSEAGRAPLSSGSASGWTIASTSNSSSSTSTPSTPSFSK